MYQAYPVRVEGRLDPGLSRWLWLVKWLLVIPHYVVLLFLWIACFALSVVAFFAILFTGRYPRGIFDFNVGVLRWTWRVGFYAFGANGTDRYPPFSLGAADYPATLAIEYPGRLSRGLVLVKWWLLAIPHYIVVGIFIGGGTWVAWHADERTYQYGGGLVGVLVLIAVITLLFTGRYPRGIFDLVLGMNRWALRVAAYAGLMTDRYPPFRLDLGGSEPGAIEVPDAEAPPPLPWTPGRVLLVVFGSLAALIASAALAAGVAAVVVDQVARDDNGYVMSPTRTFSTGTYALVSERASADLSGPDWLADDVLRTIQVRGDSVRPLFIGIGPAAEVDRYLASVAHKELTNLDRGRGRGVVVGGDQRPADPGSQGFWAATGERTVRWDLHSGDWRAVVMNADGSSGVVADLSIGARFPHLAGYGVLLLVIGGVLMAAGAGLLISAARSHPARSGPDPVP